MSSTPSQHTFVVRGIVQHDREALFRAMRMANMFPNIGEWAHPLAALDHPESDPLYRRSQRHMIVFSRLETDVRSQNMPGGQSMEMRVFDIHNSPTSSGYAFSGVHRSAFSGTLVLKSTADGHTEITCRLTLDALSDGSAPHLSFWALFFKERLPCDPVTIEIDGVLLAPSHTPPPWLQTFLTETANIPHWNRRFAFWGQLHAVLRDPHVLWSVLEQEWLRPYHHELEILLDRHMLPANPLFDVANQMAHRIDASFPTIQKDQLIKRSGWYDPDMERSGVCQRRATGGEQKFWKLETSGWFEGPGDITSCMVQTLRTEGLSPELVIRSEGRDHYQWCWLQPSNT